MRPSSLLKLAPTRTYFAFSETLKSSSHRLEHWKQNLAQDGADHCSRWLECFWGGSGDWGQLYRSAIAELAANTTVSQQETVNLPSTMAMYLSCMWELVFWFFPFSPLTHLSFWKIFTQAICDPDISKPATKCANANCLIYLYTLHQDNLHHSHASFKSFLLNLEFSLQSPHLLPFLSALPPLTEPRALPAEHCMGQYEKHPLSLTEQGKFLKWRVSVSSVLVHTWLLHWLIHTLGHWPGGSCNCIPHWRPRSIPEQQARWSRCVLGLALVR